MHKTVRFILILIFVAALVYSLINLVQLARDYKQADDIYNESRAEHFHVAPTPTPAGAAEDAPEPTAEPEDAFPEAYADIAELQVVNPEVSGWLWIPETNISYPLLQGLDNIKYLSRSYDLQYTGSGSIFTDYRSAADFSGDNTVIYGHNMNNGGMFGKLKEFGERDYLEEHPYIYIFTAERTLKYRVFAAYKTQSTSESYVFNFAEAGTDFARYLAYIAASAGENHTELPEEGALLMLSTCTSAQRTERFVVHAVLVAEKPLEQ